MASSFTVILETRERLAEVEAYVLDLDGVVTDTASLHARAWKQMFDGFLESRSGGSREDLRPFGDEDYRRFVDGKPRYDGVRSFLRARGIELDEGAPGDAAERNTVHGLGNRKNEIFLGWLRSGEVATYEDAVEAVKGWKRLGRKLAVVTSSKNGAEVLEAAGLGALFDTRVDGLTLDELGLPGKPAPDAFLEAARRLGVAPARACVFEDAVSGVEAGRSGKFGVVVGVDRNGDAAQALREHGADIVIESFDEIVASPRLASKDACLEELRRKLKGGRRLALFLDYDGTLTPIVPRPEDAVLSTSMRRVLRSLAVQLPVAIVSGRDREVIERFVGLDTIYYAGDHGFDISGPQGFREEHQEGKACLPSLDEAENNLASRLDGPTIERKRYAIAVHYRGLSEADVPAIERVVQEVAARFPDLRVTGGKKIFELRPAIDWDKGKAVLWLLEALGMSHADALPVYIGDDVTDEDAFSVLAQRDDAGLGIVVGDTPYPTAARGRLQDVSEVESFLSELLRLPVPAS